MKVCHVELVKSFTQDATQGNPLGVVRNGEDFTICEMIQVVKETGFSECVFIEKSEVATFRARFVSPEREMSMCGHAVVGLFHLLGQVGQEFTLETSVGVLPVSVKDDGLVVIQLSLPEFKQCSHSIDVIAESLGTSVSSITTVPIIVSTGTPKVLIGLLDDKHLWNLRPKYDLISEIAPTGIYCFVSVAPQLFLARQFNPKAGVNEDPVTGVAAGALGAYCFQLLKDRDPFVVEQGHCLGKIGRIYVSGTSHPSDSNDYNRVCIGGYAVHYGAMDIRIDCV